MRRQLQPELLDELPAHDPAAQHSRRDLRRINRCMGNARLVAASLSRNLRLAPPRRIVDLGAGDGAFLLQLVIQLPTLSPGTELILVDRANAADERVLAELRVRGFRPQVELADAWDWLRTRPAQPGTWVVANLFLHHFAEETLRFAFMSLSEKAAVCCACEPRRAAGPLLASRLLGLIGANAVTRHDAVVSVRAGFAGQELSGLWPADTGWQLTERRAGWFSHLFLAEKNATAAPAP